MMKRLTAFVLVLVMMLMFSSTALANSKNSYPDFGESASFYVKTKSSGEHSVKASFGKATMFVCGRGNYIVCSCSFNCRCSYEAIVYFKNKAGNWQWESQKTCYNTSSKTLTLNKDNTEYKIVIRAKDDKVVWQSYDNNGIIKSCAACDKQVKKGVGIVWKSDVAPKVTLSTVKGVGSISQ